MNLNSFQNNKLLHNILDKWHFTALIGNLKSVWFYLIVVFICHWRDIGCHWHNIVQYVTLPLLTVIFPCHALVKGCLLSSWLLFLKKFDIFGVKWNIFQKWTYSTDSQSCAILTLSTMNSVGASENITFMFSCLIHKPEWVLCWAQAMVGAVLQQEEHSYENKIT
jgi:hypothetical protein